MSLLVGYTVHVIVFLIRSEGQRSSTGSLDFSSSC